MSSIRRHTRWPRDWSSDVCSSDLRIHAIDVKREYHKDNEAYFRKKFSKERIEFHEADLLELTGSKTFDFVICIDVLEHIEEDVKVMQNLSKCLKKGDRKRVV